MTMGGRRQRRSARALRWLVLLSCACTPISDDAYTREGQPHAEAIVAAIAHDWKADELVKNADPHMLEAFPEPQIAKMMATCAKELGSVKRQQTLVVSSGVGVGSPSGKFASYIIEIEGEKATARVTIGIQRTIAERWVVVGFSLGIQPTGAGPPATVQ